MSQIIMVALDGVRNACQLKCLHSTAGTSEPNDLQMDKDLITISDVIIILNKHSERLRKRADRIGILEQKLQQQPKHVPKHWPGDPLWKEFLAESA